MNALARIFALLVGLGILVVQMSCDEPQECPSKPYQPCDDDCAEANFDPRATQHCTESPTGIADICSPTCDVDGDCPTLERKGYAYAGSCVASVCVIPCEVQAYCPAPMACRDGICIWSLE